MKTTLKEIKMFPAIDFEELDNEMFEYYAKQHKVMVAYSKGQYGISGMVWYLPNDNIWIKCTRVSSRYYRFHN